MVPVAIAVGVVAGALGARAGIAAARNRQVDIEKETQVMQQIDHFLLANAGANDDDEQNGATTTTTNELLIPVKKNALTLSLDSLPTADVIRCWDEGP